MSVQQLNSANLLMKAFLQVQELFRIKELGLKGVHDVINEI